MRDVLPSEIFFRCPACQRKLAADRDMAGKLVNCPNCRAPLVVPTRSTALDPALVRRSGALSITLIAISLLAWGGLSMIQWTTTSSIHADGTLVSLAESAPRDSRVGPPEPRPLSAAAPGSTPGERAGTYAPAAWEREIQAARQAEQAARMRYEELANWILANLRGRFLLKDRHVARLRFQPVSENFNTHPDLADFLALDEKEKSLMDDIFQYGRAAVISLQQQSLIATQTEPNVVSIVIPPFEKAGANVRDDLYAAMRTVLGPHRFERLLSVSEQEINRAYDYFGAAAREITLRLVPGATPNERPYVLIRDSWTIPQSESRRVTETTEEAVYKVPPQYAPYLAAVPDFLSPYVER